MLLNSTPQSCNDLSLGLAGTVMVVIMMVVVMVVLLRVVAMILLVVAKNRDSSVVFSD